MSSRECRLRYTEVMSDEGTRPPIPCAICSADIGPSAARSAATTSRRAAETRRPRSRISATAERRSLMANSRASLRAAGTTPGCFDAWSISRSLIGHPPVAGLSRQRLRVVPLISVYARSSTADHASVLFESSAVAHLPARAGPLDTGSADTALVAMIRARILRVDQPSAHSVKVWDTYLGSQIRNGS